MKRRVDRDGAFRKPAKVAPATANSSKATFPDKGDELLPSQRIKASHHTSDAPVAPSTSRGPQNRRVPAMKIPSSSSAHSGASQGSRSVRCSMGTAAKKGAPK